MRARRASILVFAGCLVLGTPVRAQSRWVIVNGERMSDSQVAYLEQRACTRIPNGQYWLDMQTGAWGYARNPNVQGYFGEACRQPRKSLSERGLLYRPGEILGQ
jgi:hypothetical protein